MVQIYQAPQSRQAYFKELQDDVDGDIFQLALKEASEPPKESVFKDIMDGKTAVETDLDTLEKRKKAFAFISTEIKQVITTQIK